MRRLIIVEPPVRSALWCRRLAVFGAALAVIAVLGSRLHLIDPDGAIAVLAAALGFATLALLTVPVGAVLVWRTGHPGIGAMLGGIALAALVFAYPAYLAIRARHLPAISDVVTDPTLPLAFSTSPAALAARGQVQHEPPNAADLQKAATAYPDVSPLTLDTAPADVERAALKLVRKRRWTVVEAKRPSGMPAVGSIDAIAHTTVMGFPLDIVIRIAGAGAGGSRVDMRSASRWRRRDLGANAALIEAFLSDLEDATDQE